MVISTIQNKATQTAISPQILLLKSFLTNGSAPYAALPKICLKRFRGYFSDFNPDSGEIGSLLLNQIVKWQKHPNPLNPF